MDQVLLEKVNCRLPMTGATREAAGGAAPEELIILLHGFAESGVRFLGEVKDALPSHARVISLNGPYPVPVRKENRLGYAWYFYHQGHYFIPPGSAAEFVANGVRALNPDGLPVRIVAFSQGGYLAPFAAVKIPEVKQLVVVNGEFLTDEWIDEWIGEWSATPSFRIDAIQATEDKVVPFSDGQASFEKMIRAGVPGEFHPVRGSGHFMDEAIRNSLRAALERFAPVE